MKFLLIIILSFSFLSCGWFQADQSDKIASLEATIQKLQNDLETETDPEVILAKQTELTQKRLAVYYQKEKELEGLWDALQATKNLPDCEARSAEFKTKERELNDYGRKIYPSFSPSLEQYQCTDSGYKSIELLN